MDGIGRGDERIRADGIDNARAGPAAGTGIAAPAGFRLAAAATAARACPDSGNASARAARRSGRFATAAAILSDTVARLWSHDRRAARVRADR